MPDSNHLLQPHLTTELWMGFQFLVCLFIVFLLGKLLYKRLKSKDSDASIK